MALSVHYHLSDYISHRVAGQANRAALAAAGVELADDPDQADAIVIHDDPHFYPQWVERYGGKKPVVAYCVWETEVLPGPFCRNLRGVDRIWTCSPFSARAFLDAGMRNVDVVPHVVDPAEPTSEDHERVARLLGRGNGQGFDHGPFTFYTVVDSVNPRKNLETLLKVFEKIYRPGRDVRLVVKQYRLPWDLDGLSGVVSITDELTPGQMSALHQACHAYVSAHHAEAWGLSLSDAMRFARPVIATGYSGNMYYMDETNSFPVRYELAPVNQKMCRILPLFTPDMRWAEVDQDHMAYCMRKAASGLVDQALTNNARTSVERFSPDKVGAIMRTLLEILQ